MEVKTLNVIPWLLLTTTFKNTQANKSWCIFNDLLQQDLN